MDKISETAFLVAMYRALESERPDALFQDPWARRLAGGQGALQATVLGQMRQGANAIALRTRMMDDVLMRLVDAGAVETVLNLAAGLDARPYRLNLPATLHWIEVDLPEILAYKAQVLQEQSPHCRLEHVDLDLKQPERTTLFSRVNQVSGGCLVMTEGILGYLSPEAVATLAMDLHQQPQFRWWLLELLPPTPPTPARPYGQKLFDQYLGGGKGFQFAPQQGAAFFERYGWRAVEVHSVWNASRRLKRSAKLAWLWEWLLRLFARQQWKAMTRSGIVLLERVA